MCPQGVSGGLPIAGTTLVLTLMAPTGRGWTIILR